MDAFSYLEQVEVVPVLPTTMEIRGKPLHPGDHGGPALGDDVRPQLAEFRDVAVPAIQRIEGKERKEGTDEEDGWTGTG